MELMQWLASGQAFLVVMVIACAVANNRLYFHHVCAGRTRHKHFGLVPYFWQLARAGERAGERDGYVAMLSSCVGLLAATVLMVTSVRQLFG